MSIYQEDLSQGQDNLEFKFWSGNFFSLYFLVDLFTNF